MIESQQIGECVYALLLEMGGILFISNFRKEICGNYFLDWQEMKEFRIKSVNVVKVFANPVGKIEYTASLFKF